MPFSFWKPSLKEAESYRAEKGWVVSLLSLLTDWSKYQCLIGKVTLHVIFVFNWEKSQPNVLSRTTKDYEWISQEYAGLFWVSSKYLNYLPACSILLAHVPSKISGPPPYKELTSRKIASEGIQQSCRIKGNHIRCPKCRVSPLNVCLWEGSVFCRHSF